MHALSHLILLTLQGKKFPYIYFSGEKTKVSLGLKERSDTLRITHIFLVISIVLSGLSGSCLIPESGVSINPYAYV